MKNLELENFGVQELDAKEMREMNGGSWFGRIAVAAGFALFVAATGGAGLAVGAALFAGGAIEDAVN